MKLIDVLAKIKQQKQTVLQTKDVATLLQTDIVHASKLLGRLAESGHLLHIARSLWALPDSLDPLMLPEYLTAPSPSYISLQTALYYHGMISQIPSVIYVISLARTRRFHTPVGDYSIHRMTPELFTGYTSVGEHDIKLATPEKALVDYLYLYPSKTKLFRRLTEVEFPETFQDQVANDFIQLIPSASRRTSVRERYIDLRNKRLSEILK